MEERRTEEVMPVVGYVCNHKRRKGERGERGREEGGGEEEEGKWKEDEMKEDTEYAVCLPVCLTLWM